MLMFSRTEKWLPIDVLFDNELDVGFLSLAFVLPFFFPQLPCRSSRFSLLLLLLLLPSFQLHLLFPITLLAILHTLVLRLAMLRCCVCSGLLPLLFFLLSTPHLPSSFLLFECLVSLAPPNSFTFSSCSPDNTSSTQTAHPWPSVSSPLLPQSPM